MTTSTQQELARRAGRPKADSVALVMATMFMTAAQDLGAAEVEFTWPSEEYRHDPVRFAREILGVDLWPRQIEVLESIRDNRRTAVSGGRKVGKDFLVAVAALWYFASFPEANVIITATTARQVDEILWKQIRMLYIRSGRCLACKRKDPSGPTPCPHSHVLDGELMEQARTGLRAKSTFRSITGFTANEAEAVSGISGRSLLYLFDEASGIDDVIFEHVKGNLAAGGDTRMCLISNPTRNEGEFFRAFHDRAHLYKGFYVSSLESPNIVTGQDIWPGLAGREWVDEMRQDWGEGSPNWMVHVLGRFLEHEEGKIVSLHALKVATEQWETTGAEGRLVIGLDPAGPSFQGDESAFAVRRGKKVIEVYGRSGMSEGDILVHLLGLCHKHGTPGELPIVVVDREGNIGAAVYGMLRAQAEIEPAPFTVVGVRSSDKAYRTSRIYERVRDELWASVADWVKNGGALPSDAKLLKQLHAPSWEGTPSNKLKVTAKEELRGHRSLGHSPDRADAVCLCCWMDDVLDYGLQLRTAAESIHDSRIPEMDPYSNWTPAIDPYAAWGGQG